MKHATLGNEVNTFTPSPNMRQLAKNWLKEGGSLYPKSIMQGSDHEFECFTQAVESMQNDPSIVRL